MTHSTVSLQAAPELETSPEADRRSFGWLLVALVPAAIFASTVTSLACMG